MPTSQTEFCLILSGVTTMLSSIDNVSIRFLMPSSLQSSMADSCASVGVRIALFLTQSAKPTHSLVVANKKARNTFLYSSTIDYLYFTISSHLLSAFLAILAEFRPTLTADFIHISSTFHGDKYCNIWQYF